MGERMLDKTAQPDERAVSDWIGPESFLRWKTITRFIEQNYSGVFSPDDWLYGGKKHGWACGLKNRKRSAPSFRSWIVFLC